jgi:hypothetical protein
VAADDVVPERIVDEVGNEAFGHGRLADGWCGDDGGLDIESELVDLGTGAVEHVGDDF